MSRYVSIKRVRTEVQSNYSVVDHIAIFDALPYLYEASTASISAWRGGIHAPGQSFHDVHAAIITSVHHRLVLERLDAAAPVDWLVIDYTDRQDRLRFTVSPMNKALFV